MLTETLIAAAILLAVLGSALSLVDPARGALVLQPSVAEMNQRMRVATTRLQTDLRMAGTGPHPTAGSTLSRLRAPLVPALVGQRHSPDSGTAPTQDAVTVLFSPPRSVQGRLTSDLRGSPAIVRLSFEGMGCGGRRSKSPCGVEAGGLALVFDTAGRSEVFRITKKVDETTLQLQAVGGGIPLPFRAGDSIIPLELHGYYFDREASQLRVQDGWVSDFPLLDDVVGLSVRYFGRASVPPGSGREEAIAPCLAQVRRPTLVQTDRIEPELELEPRILGDGPWCGGRLSFDIDLFRVTRVRIEIRLQAGAEGLRGQDRSLFVNPGSGRPGRIAPDLIGVIEVSPRGVSGG
jgi:hypothetical protein